MKAGNIKPYFMRNIQFDLNHLSFNEQIINYDIFNFTSNMKFL